MIKPSSHFDKNQSDTESPDRARTSDSEDEAPPRRMSEEERRKKFEAALEDTMEKYDWALRKLAE